MDNLGERPFSKIRNGDKAININHLGGLLRHAIDQSPGMTRNGGFSTIFKICHRLIHSKVLLTSLFVEKSVSDNCTANFQKNQ